MKVLLYVAIVAVLAIGARAQNAEPEPEPLTPEERSQKIRELEVLVNQLKLAVARYIRIGKTNVAKLQAVMNRVDKRRYQCLVLETLRPAPIPLQTLPPVPLKPVTQTLTMDQVSNKIRQLEAKIQRIVTAATRYVSIGKGNIGLMQRIRIDYMVKAFAEASRNAVCGADYYKKCPMGFIYESNADSCFREVVGRFKSFTAAQEKCHQRGGHLPRVESVAENNAIAGLLQLGVQSPAPEDNTHAVWIGLHHNGDKWQWVHPEDNPIDLNAEGSYTNFASTADDATKQCAYLCLRSNKWVKTSCDTKTRILCERPKNPPPQVSSTK